MKCRKELPPIEAYLEFLTKLSYGASEDGTETSVYTSKVFSPDLRLKLEIEHRLAEGDIRPAAVFKCEIQQSHRQQEVLGYYSDTHRYIMTINFAN
jgi:hypothetical protein